MTPNDLYISRTTPLTSKRCILGIYSANVGTEYFKHVLYSPFFLSSKCSLFHNANLFGSCIIHILYTGCAKIKKKFRRQRVNLDTCGEISPTLYRTVSVYPTSHSNTRHKIPSRLPAISCTGISSITTFAIYIPFELVQRSQRGLINNVMCKKYFCFLPLPLILLTWRI